MPRIILNTHSSNEDYDADCSYAVVDVTTQLVNTLKRECDLVKALHEKDASVYQVIFWGSPADYYGTELAGAAEDAGAIGEEFNAEGYAVLPATFTEFIYEDVPIKPQRIECGQTIVSIDKRYGGLVEVDVSFFCLPKYGNIEITTQRVTIDWLASLIQEPPNDATGVVG